MPLGSQPAASRQPLDATLASASASAVPIGSSSGSTVGGGLIPIRDEQFAAYLKEVEDAFYFMKEFLANLYGEANRLDTELDTMMVPPPFPFLLSSWFTILLCSVCPRRLFAAPTPPSCCPSSPPSSCRSPSWQESSE